MTSTFEDTVFDFDLNFLRHTTNNTSLQNQSKFDRQKRSISIVKKKIIATDSLIAKYYAKRHELEETQRDLLAAKDECKQICIDYTNALETCSKLETDAQIIQRTNKQFEERYFNSENQCEAFKSHANQLQALVNEQKSTIEALKADTKLEKASIVANEKKVSSLQKENDTYFKHLCRFRDIILGKRKLNSKYRDLLQNYTKSGSEKNSDDSLSEEENSDTGDDIFEDVLSPYNNHDSPQNNASEVQKCEVTSKNVTPMELDTDCSNEIVSVDTGRGSSLAFSDSEKCFNSPDYFVEDSPSSRETIENKVKPKLVTIATSPLPPQTTVEIATSPVNVLQEDPVLYQIIIEEDNSLDNSIISQKQKVTQDRSLSPIKLNVNKSVFTSPIRTVNKEVATSPLKVSNIVHVQKSPKPVQEKECLERNNSKNFLDDNSYDCEIESILHAMRLNYEIVTPIPPTPSKSCCIESTTESNKQIKHVEHSKSYVCQDAALAWEENKKMHASIAHLAKEIVNIKCLLKTQLFANKMFANKDSDATEVEDLFNDCEMDSVMDDGDHVTHPDVDDERNVCSPLVDDPIIIPNLDLQLIQPADLNIDPSHSEFALQSCEIVSDGDTTQHTLVGNKSPEQIMHRLQFEDTMSVSSMANDSINTQALDVATLDLENTNHNSNVEAEKTPSAKDNHDKIVRNKKLTKLEKLKKKLVPKYKIKRDRVPPPPKKLRVRPKQLLPPNKNIKITVSDSSASLNDKNVYEKAVKVMAELKAKQSITPKRSAKTNVNITDQNNTNPLEDLNNDDSGNLVSPTPSITTRGRRKCAMQSESSETLPEENKIQTNHNPETISLEPIQEANTKILKETSGNISRASPRVTRKRNRQSSSDKCEVQCKRMLRSSTIQQQSTNDDSKKCEIVTENHDVNSQKPHTETVNSEGSDSQSVNVSVPDLSEGQAVKQIDDRAKVVAYDDLDIFSDRNDRNCSESESRIADNCNKKSPSVNPRESILCTMVLKYGKQSFKLSAKKISDGALKSICGMIESNIAKILEVPTNETKNAMNKFVADAQRLNYKHFISGLMIYLKSPERKAELFAKVVSPPAPAMTKSEQILLYVIAQVRNFWPLVDAADGVLCNIEYILFKLNQTPEFDVIESLSHFYAVLCRYFKAKSRLRLFILDAMYCIRYKAIPLIKQCLDVWMHIIPLAHMGIAKSPLVMCLIYLLHFYKCEDKAQRIQEIRNILHHKYFYKISEWNETKVLEMFKNSIKDLKDVPTEKKSLRLALIILAKRHGPRWCQNNIIKNMLQPLIEKQDVPDKVKEFCLSMIGPLMKPYPVDMKVHCEIAITQLIDMWNKNPSKRMEEAIVTSLVYMSKHNLNRVNKMLLTHKLDVSPELESVLRDFVREKPLKMWKNIISRTRLDQSDVEDNEYY